MRVLIQHRSRYVYPSPTLLGPQIIRLRPADHARAAIESYRLEVSPDNRVHWQRDPHGNQIARVTFKAGQRAAALEMLVEMAVDVRPVNPFDFFVDDRAKKLPFAYPDGLANELAPYLDTGDPAYDMGPRATELLTSLPASGDTIDVLVRLNSAVNASIRYVIRDEPGVWTPEETLTNGRGSCRDAAVLLVALMRARGIAARFVSGYLVQLTDEGMIPDEPKGVDRDVVDLHAWAEAYVPGGGWIGFDGTSGLLCGEGHIPLASTATPLAAAPLDGTSEFGASSVEFATTIMRLGHEARPTAPMTDSVWDELLAAGDRADAILDGAKLTAWIGGEPTFCAREGQTAEEWQGGALGEDKWQRGRALAATLRDRLAPGGVVLYRQGKHYPGESRPRWALDVIGRRGSGELWPTRDVRDSGAIGEAERFGEALATSLGVDLRAGFVLHPAFEDPWEVLRAEAALPPEIDPRTAGLDDPEERKRLAQIMTRGVGTAVGYVLPLARIDDEWVTEAWTFRRGELFLLPGDSPIGLRLPLAGLGDGLPPPAWADEPDIEDPRIEPTTSTPTIANDGIEKVQPKRAVRPPVAATPIGVRTALTVEPRDGQLWVFLPPVPRFADFCVLVDAIDRARVATGLAVHLEGYPPPPSPERLRFAVTPDPGVLEVNLPPAASSREVTALYQTVFDAALANGLTAERYMLDGRAAGSGGGNHITIGGPTALRSPWLERPSLLASLITFVQHHPSLSYAFTGLFVGPTSQAPRVDEARHDVLYELEIALPRLFSDDVPTWQVDALLRHLLVDIAGSTHRAEISIDKLVDPLTPFGRQGLVELRAFEMPPHPRMLAAQAILVRSLLAAFTSAPYQHPLVRWGEELHDRFLLPYFLWRDLEDVLAFAKVPADAYRAFLELRCPLVGELPVGDATVELRNAIEPWNVLGEEATTGGTARYVDSSMERIELRTHGLDLERYAVAINNCVLPMRKVAGRDTHVGGVRFRAWCPPHSMHPHLGIHHPLRIDVVDQWAKRGVIAGSYHVWHPEGRAFEAPPLTRVEAAARRAKRFAVHGASPLPLRLVTPAPHPQQPYTLDLRRVDAGMPMPRTEDWM